MSNTITAYFKGRVGVAESVYQNDYGIVMVFDSIDLPAHFDCYFSMLNQDESFPGVGAYDGTDNRVVIPNDVLANPGTVTVHIPLHTGENDSEVEYVAYFKVIGRARPVDDGTPAQMTAIEQALALLQTPIGKIEEIVNEALSFTGDTFAEMQAALDADQAAFKSEVRDDIADVESDVDNLNAQFQTAVGAVTTDTEVTNIRVGDDNFTYSTAGDAVRKQMSAVKGKVDYIADIIGGIAQLEFVRGILYEGQPLTSESFDKIVMTNYITLDYDVTITVASGYRYLYQYVISDGDVTDEYGQNTKVSPNAVTTNYTFPKGRPFRLCVLKNGSTYNVPCDIAELQFALSITTNNLQEVYNTRLYVFNETSIDAASYSKTLSDYAQKKITIERIGYNISSIFPSKAGMLYTYNLWTSEAAYQRFDSYDNKGVWIRKFDSSGNPQSFYKLIEDRDLDSAISEVSDDIASIEDDFEIDFKSITGTSKNLIDVLGFSPAVSPYTVITPEANSIHVVTTGAEQTGILSTPFALSSGSNYRISADIDITSGAVNFILMGSDDGETWSFTSVRGIQTSESGHFSALFQAPNKKHLRWFVQTTPPDVTDADLIISNLQLETGCQETEYVNYRSAVDSVARETDKTDVAVGQKNAENWQQTSSVFSILKENDALIEDTSRNQNAKKVIVKSKKSLRPDKSIPNLRRIVAINHDDLGSSDYLSTRKIYNKYGFRGNYNFILMPFKSEAHKEEFVQGIKQMVKDGNDLGLHAICNKSAWILNSTMDIRPDGSSTFAPTLSEISTVISGGKNIFGYTVTNSSKATDVGFVAPPASVANVNITSMTSQQYKDLLSGYCIYTDTTAPVGIDVDGVSRTWSVHQWLEHWYNRLISDDLGYSSDESSISDRFAEDYEIPEGGILANYYPDAAHLKSGKIVFFDDTSNPHYSDSSYQKVGRFTKGIYKGCASTCNGEIIDRLIEVAKAFLHHYAGVDDFKYFNRHGGGHVQCFWYDEDYIPFADREKTLLSGLYTKTYHSRSGMMLTPFDHLKNNGIRITGHVELGIPTGLLNAMFEGQVGLYFGQAGIRSPFFNCCHPYSGHIDYLATIDPSPYYSWGNISKEKFMQYFGDVDNWIKYTYEHANENIGTDDDPMYVMDYVKDFIDVVRGCKDTGKVPFFSYDTVVDDASCLTAFEMICQYCYDHNITLVTPEEALS